MGLGAGCARGGVRRQPCRRLDRGFAGLKDRRRLNNDQVPRVAGMEEDKEQGSAGMLLILRLQDIGVPLFYSYSFFSILSPSSSLSLPALHSLSSSSFPLSPSLSPSLPLLPSLPLSTRSKLLSSCSFLAKPCRVEFLAGSEPTCAFSLARGWSDSPSISHACIQVSPASGWELFSGCSGTPCRGAHIYPK